MVEQNPNDNNSSAAGSRLGGGAIAALTGVGLLVIFIVQNTDKVKLDFLVWTFTWPLWLLTIVSALLGAVLLHWRRVAPAGEGARMTPHRSSPMPRVPSSAFKGFRFPPEIIVLALWVPKTRPGMLTWGFALGCSA